MTIGKPEVEKIAQLAKLSVDESEVGRYADELSNILSFVEQLSEIDTDGVTPMAHPLEMTQRLRPDKITESNQRGEFQNCAPQTEKGLYLVPKVIE
tara:strand:- start:88 stop:375 length:288 start_codon:yes stop_codon:yes gene_type:complete